MSVVFCGGQAGAEIVGKYVGESESKLREVFESATRTPGGKTIIFIDEIDALAPSRSKGGAGQVHATHRRLLLSSLLSFGQAKCR